MTYFETYRQTLGSSLAAVDISLIEEFRVLLAKTRGEGRHIYTCGNGGSAATASHFATDLGKGASFGKQLRFKVVALTDATPTISAYSNDVSYDVVYEEQLRNFVAAGDVVVAISGSGNSENVIRAVQLGEQRGARTVALTGRDGGRLGPAAGLHINVPEQHMGRIEDAHMAICHMVAFSFIDSET